MDNQTIFYFWPKGSSLYQQADFDTHFAYTSPDRPLHKDPLPPPPVKEVCTAHLFSFNVNVVKRGIVLKLSVPINGLVL